MMEGRAEEVGCRRPPLKKDADAFELRSMQFAGFSESENSLAVSHVYLHSCADAATAAALAALAAVALLEFGQV